MGGAPPQQVKEGWEDGTAPHPVSTLEVLGGGPLRSARHEEHRHGCTEANWCRFHSYEPRRCPRT